MLVPPQGPALVGMPQRAPGPALLLAVPQEPARAPQELARVKKDLRLARLEPEQAPELARQELALARLAQQGSQSRGVALQPE